MAGGDPEQPARRRTVPLALALLAAVTALVSVIAGIVIGENYRRGLAAAMNMGQRLFNNLRTDIAVQQQQLVQPIEFAIAVLSENPALGDGRAHDLENSFLAVLERHPQIIELRAAYAGGEVFAVAHLDDAEGPLRTSISAPAMASYAARRVARGSDGRWRMTWTFIAADRSVVGQQTTTIAEPRHDAEPWYAVAANAPGHVVQTRAAVITPLPTVGISFARTFTGPQPGVIASDVSLKQLAEILRYLKFDAEDQIFLFDDENRLVASPDVESTYYADGEITRSSVDMLPHPIVRAMKERFHAVGIFTSEVMVAGGTQFLTSVIRLGEEIEGRPAIYLAFATPASTFTGAFADISRDTALVSIAILLAAVPGIVWVARRMARPLTELEKVTDGIARLDMTQSADVPTRISEIDRLGRSIGDMKNALSQVAKFVPKTLVQQLIRSRIDVSVGGERRELSFMFSDVRDFTPLAEALPAEELMEQMAAYLDALAGVVLEHHGTVDKYVGDAIFAFWNAPAILEDHPVLACQAALSCRAASNAINDQWRHQGRPVWYTRFGVHLGDAVVGNVGSRDRLDYTAIGRAVNTAARLEGLNKFYGTQILASEAVVKRAGDCFLFRPIDRVLAKGTAEPMVIYELLSARDEAAAAVHARCAAWAEAYAMYQDRDWHGAHARLEKLAADDSGDGVAAAFRDRIAALLAAPPADWDGVTRFDTK